MVEVLYGNPYSSDEDQYALHEEEKSEASSLGSAAGRAAAWKASAAARSRRLVPNMMEKLYYERG